MPDSWLANHLRSFFPGMKGGQLDKLVQGANAEKFAKQKIAEDRAVYNEDEYIAGRMKEEEEKKEYYSQDRATQALLFGLRGGLHDKAAFGVLARFEGMEE